MSNSTETICVAPLTPTYSTLPRLNVTFLSVFVLLAPTSSWATKGALAALMVRGATISIHAMVLLGTKSSSSPFELDTIGSFFILIQLALATPIMLCWAPALSQSKARLHVRIWGVLVFTGAMCAFAALTWARELVDASSCQMHSTTGGQDTAVNLERGSVFSQLEIGTVTGVIDIAAVVGASFGVWTCLRPDSWCLRNSKRRWSTCVYVFEIIGVTFAWAVLIPAVEQHEKYMLGKPSIPMLLPVTSFEQWNCWAATGLAVAATLVNAVLGKGNGGRTQHITTVNLSEGSEPTFVTKSDPEWAGIVGRPCPSYIS